MFDDLLDANRRYASSFGLRGLSSRAARGFALVTCMDTRIEPLAMLGLRPGDAKILRNAGARVTDDVLRSLVLATHFLGVVGVAVMQHEDCALAGRRDQDVLDELGRAGVGSAGHGVFLAMPDPDASLRADVETVRTCGRLPAGVQVEGWRYSEQTGLIRRIVVAGPAGR